MYYTTETKKKEDGTKYQIQVDYMTGYGSGNRWILRDIIYTPPRKRTSQYLKKELENDTRGRNYTWEEREKIIKKGLVEFVGIDEINNAFMEAYEHMKPPTFTEKDLEKEVER